MGARGEDDMGPSECIYIVQDSRALSLACFILHNQVLKCIYTKEGILRHLCLGGGGTGKNHTKNVR
jgi:hypothetical protein